MDVVLILSIVRMNHCGTREVLKKKCHSTIRQKCVPQAFLFTTHNQNVTLKTLYYA